MKVIFSYFVYNVYIGGDIWLLVVDKCLLIDRLRKAGLTQQQLAEFTNIPKSTISQYVSGKHIMSLERAKTIAYVLNCNIDDLYQWKSVKDDRR